MMPDLAPLIAKRDWYSVSRAIYDIVSMPEMYLENQPVSAAELGAIVAQINDCTYALDKTSLAQLYALYVKTLPMEEGLQFIEKERSIFANHPEAFAVMIALQYLMYTSVLNPKTLDHNLNFDFEQQLHESLSSEAFIISSHAEMMALEAAIRYAIVEKRYYDIYLFYQRMVQVAVVAAWAYSILDKYFPIAVYSALYVEDHPTDLLSLMYTGVGKRNADHPCVCDDREDVDESSLMPCSSQYCVVADMILCSAFSFKHSPVHDLVCTIVEGNFPADSSLPVIVEFQLNFTHVKEGIRTQVLRSKLCSLLYNAPLAKRSGYPYRDLMTGLGITSVIELERFLAGTMRTNILEGKLNTLTETLTVTIIRTQTASPQQIAIFGKRLRDWADKVSYCRSLLERQM